MTAQRYSVQLTREEIDYVRTSLDYSLKRLRDIPMPTESEDDRKQALGRRQGYEGLSTSIKEALTAAIKS
jgi:hypothetical protein